jgi:hypothetical protein
MGFCIVIAATRERHGGEPLQDNSKPLEERAQKNKKKSWGKKKKSSI